MSKVGIIGGVHCFKFSVGVSERPVKVGLTKDNNVPQNTAFSDFEPGFAYYTVGQTRNESDGSGLLYGPTLDCTQVNNINMELATGEGTMKFSISGKPYGIAFTEELLKSGPFYIAVAVRKTIGVTKVVPINVI